MPTQRRVADINVSAKHAAGHQHRIDIDDVPQDAVVVENLAERRIILAPFLVEVVSPVESNAAGSLIEVDIWLFAFRAVGRV